MATSINQWYSGPIWSVCPHSTGRDGDFKSSAFCKPCPPNESNIMIMLRALAILVLMVSLMVYSTTHKGAHDKEHAKHHERRR